MDADNSPQSKGGKVRAARLTRERKKEIGRAAANARWHSDGEIPDAVSIEKAQVANDLILGGVTIPCAVLEDGTRVLSERGISSALGRTRSGSHWQKKREQGAKLPLYLTAGNLIPFISKELSKALSEPRWYKPPHGGRLVAGVPATCLPDICDVWISAYESGKLRKPQLRIAITARAIQRALAKTGIVALIDEATGYQEFRSRTELQALLAAYLAEELLPWSQRFPIAYYQEMFRLWGWQWPPSSGIQGPRYAGKLTKQIIYDQLPDGVLQELETRNPPDENWQRKDRHHQHLTPEIGQPHLEKQVAVATNLMKVCDDKDEFLDKFERAFPGTFTKAKQLNLFRKPKKE